MAMSSMEAKETWWLLRSGAGEAAYNMALDEVLLGAVLGLGRPVLRVYGWTGAPATFGYAQRWSEVAAKTGLRPLVRRPTGGGLVLHDEDFTYTVVFPPAHPWACLRARESYRQLHEWISGALRLTGVTAELAPSASAPSVGVCFAGAEESDVVAGALKLAGAAQRRNRQGLLIQGSVRMPLGGVDRGSLEVALLAAAEQRWVGRWEVLRFPGALVAEAGSLARAKYATERHNRLR